MEFGPIEPGYLAAWLEERMEERGVRCDEVGPECVQIAGPRTRDVIQLARKTFDLTAGTGRADAESVRHAFEELVEEEDGPIRSWWDDLTPAQQNIIRAVAATTAGMTTAETAKRFTLLTSSAVTQAIQKLREDGDVTRGGPSGYVLDSPVVRGWVISKALPDLGMRLPATYRPDDPYRSPTTR
jgi:DNA-directed RNA polymerase subunit F